MSSDFQFTIRTDYITLSQLLKAADLVSSGAGAKDLLAGGGILVNGEGESRRGRKLWPGDIVSFADGTTIRIQ